MRGVSFPVRQLFPSYPVINGYKGVAKGTGKKESGAGGGARTANTTGAVEARGLRTRGV